MDEIFRRPQLSKGLSRTDERQEVQADLERADNGYARSFEAVLGNRLPTLQNAQAPAEALLNELQHAEGYANRRACRTGLRRIHGAGRSLRRRSGRPFVRVRCGTRVRHTDSLHSRTYDHDPRRGGGDSARDGRAARPDCADGDPYRCGGRELRRERGRVSRAGRDVARTVGGSAHYCDAQPQRTSLHGGSLGNPRRGSTAFGNGGVARGARVARPLKNQLPTRPKMAHA